MPPVDGGVGVAVVPVANAEPLDDGPGDERRPAAAEAAVVNEQFERHSDFLSGRSSRSMNRGDCSAVALRATRPVSGQLMSMGDRDHSHPILDQPIHQPVRVTPQLVIAIRSSYSGDASGNELMNSSPLSTAASNPAAARTLRLIPRQCCLIFGLGGRVE